MTKKEKAIALDLLIEAARRWLCFDRPAHQNTLTSAWTGLGFRYSGRSKLYAVVEENGLMRDVTLCNRRSPTWWALTKKGAAIVQRWIDEGLTAKDFSGMDCVKNLSLDD